MLNLDLKTFYSYVRRDPFGGSLSQSEVDGLDDALEACGNAGVTDLRKVAYILATGFHETGGRMQPVRETFAKSDAQARKRLSSADYAQVDPDTGQAYYGRGDVQLTWKSNYGKMGKALGLPLVDSPDLALQSRHSKRILVEGMISGETGKGDFTGHKLSDYFNNGTNDPVGARRIVNGTDKADLIARYHQAFFAALEAAWEAQKGARQPEDTGRPKKGVPKDRVSIGALVSGVSGAVGAVTTLLEGINDYYSLGAFGIVAVGAYMVLSGRVNLQYLTDE